MPELMINDEGIAIDAEGNPVLIGEEPIRIGNAQNQAQVEAAIKKRLARQSEHIKTLEQQATKTPELMAMIDRLKEEKQQTEAEAARTKEFAEKRVATQLADANKAREAALQALEQERAARLREQVSMLIISKAKNDFINPGEDIVPKLLSKHKREPKLDDNGKPIDGQFIDLFDVNYTNEKGDLVTESMPIEKALDVFRTQEAYQHYVRGFSPGGSGGASFRNGPRITKTSQLPTDAAKAHFISDHGLDAFKALLND